MPTTLTRSTTDRKHVLMESKTRHILGHILIEDYRNEVISSMRGKTGSLRSITSITVEGSLKMVISPYPHTSESVISIPQHIAMATTVPNVVNGIVVESSIENGDVGLLVRQPCLWTGSIRQCRVEVSTPANASTFHMQKAN